MHPFNYTRAADVNAALTGHNAQTNYLAGGTSLLDLMKLDVMTPARLIDINGLPLTKIEPTAEGGVRIGAMVRNSDLAYDETIRKNYPLLSQALLAGASPQLRNMASVGGNLMQRTRCYYFRDTAMPCNKREPGSGCSALEGFNRIHSIFGASRHCIATHPSDMCVALAALEAVIHTQGPQGERTIPIGEFHLLPGDTPHIETVLKPGELITSVTLPPSPFAAHSRYIKVRERSAYAFALVSAAAALEMQDGHIRSCRLAFGSVAHKPWRSQAAEKSLEGRSADEKGFAEAARIAVQGAKTYKFNGYKVEMLRRTVVRALKAAAQA